MIIPFLLLLGYVNLILPMQQFMQLPTLKELCFDEITKIPPEQFALFQQIPLDLKLQFIIRHGLHQTPTLFSLLTNQQDDDNQPRISGQVLADRNLKLANRFTDVFINQEDPTPSTHERELSSLEYTFAYLHHKNLYIGTQTGNITHYGMNPRTPKLIDTQNVADQAIVQIAVHPTIEHLISCKLANGSLVILRKDKDGLWQQINQIIINRSIKHMSFCPSDKWFACAERTKVYIYDLKPNDDGQLKPPKNPICTTDVIETIIFDQNKNLIIQGRKGASQMQQLLVWEFQNEAEATLYTIWPESAKITLNQDGHFDSLLDDNAIDQTANQILFKANLSHIQTLKELAVFKHFEKDLHCGDQPLFKIIATINKKVMLQKKLAQKK